MVLAPFVGPTLIVPDPAERVTTLNAAGVSVPVAKVMLLLVVVNPTVPLTLIAPLAPAV